MRDISRSGCIANEIFSLTRARYQTSNTIHKDRIFQYLIDIPIIPEIFIYIPRYILINTSKSLDKASKYPDISPLGNAPHLHMESPRFCNLQFSPSRFPAP